MLIVVYDLSSLLSPGRAVAALEGLDPPFKRTERHLKRLVRGDAIADAVSQGGVRTMRVRTVAEDPPALLVDRRWTSLPEFPFTSRVDTELGLLQHTTFVTNRVSLVCEAGDHDAVRVEWDFPRASSGGAPDAERVDWLLQTLGVRAAPAALTLARLLRVHKGAAPTAGNDGEGGRVQDLGGREGREGAGAAPGGGPEAEGPDGPQGPADA